ncbi:tape measure protein [Maritalea myrionectae]|uniref:Tape measure protein n=1 Tax=Maritalea myrionectae TaxID=454601 RepID=A0A2R4MEE8_9HYPH|nr:phage tail tape measure protein [Maritalea myrionectae]AVX04353.1 tape measure protein [Maritalea myrionectae]
MMDLSELGLAISSDGVVVANNRLEEFEKRGFGAERAANRLARSAARMAAQFIAVAAATFSLNRTINTISGFEKSISQVQAITRATSVEMDRLRDVAREMGATTEFSASQAADGMRFLGMAGFTAAESIASIPAVLDLATASSMGLAQSADITSNIMSGFGIVAENSAEVTDVLAAASSRANTSVSQLGQAMSTVAPIASSLEIELSDTAAAIGVLSDAGIQGERAGTAMRGVLASLAGPTKQAEEVLKRLGLTIQDVNPATNDLSVVLARLREAGLSTADAMTIFGREAASGALVLVEAADRVSEFGEELSKVDGEAKRMAETMRDNLGGDLKTLASTIESVILTMGEAGLTGVLRASTQALTEMFRALGDNMDNVIIVIATLSAGLGAYALAAGGAAIATGTLTVAVGTFATTLAVLTGPAGLFALAVAGLTGFVLWTGKSKDAMLDYNDVAADLVEVQGKLEQSSGDVSEALATEAREKLNSAEAALELAAADREATLAHIQYQKALQAGANALEETYGTISAGTIVSNSQGEIDAAMAELDRIQSKIDEINAKKVQIEIVVGTVLSGSLVGEQFASAQETVKTEETDSGGGGTVSTGGGAGTTYSDLIAMAQERIDQLAVEAEALQLTTGAAAALRFEQEMIAQAANDNIALGPAQLEQIALLGEEMAKAKLKVEGVQLALSQRSPWEIARDEIAQLNEMLKLGAIEWDTYAHAAFQAKAEVAASALGLASGLSGALAQMFKDNKAFAIANAVVNTAEAVTKALATYGPTPWGFAAAGVAAASGAAQIAAISSAQRGSGSVPSVSGGGQSSAPQQTAPATEPQRTTNVTLVGNGFSPEQIVELLNEALGDGHKINVNTAA